MWQHENSGKLRSRKLGAVQFEKGEYSFNARKKVIERVGLPEVRQFRLRQLSSEYALWLRDIDKKRRVIPDMVLHTIIEIKG